MRGGKVQLNLSALGSALREGALANGDYDDSNDDSEYSSDEEISLAMEWADARQDHVRSRVTALRAPSQLNYPLGASFFALFPSYMRVQDSYVEFIDSESTLFRYFGLQTTIEGRRPYFIHPHPPRRHLHSLICMLIDLMPTAERSIKSNEATQPHETTLSTRWTSAWL